MSVRLSGRSYKLPRLWLPSRCYIPRFSDTFDKVPQQRLLMKLAEHGLDGDILQWIGSIGCLTGNEELYLMGTWAVFRLS